MGLAAAINTAKSYVVNRLTEENPDTYYVGSKPTGTEFFQCDLSDTKVAQESENFRVYHQTNIYVSDFKFFHDPTKQHSNIEKFKLSANLPKSFSYSFGGTWEQPIAGAANSSIDNFFVQAGGRPVASLIDAFTNYTMGTKTEDAILANASSLSNLTTTSLVWTKADPMEIQLEIPVFDDRTVNAGYEANGRNVNLREALNLLSNLALPNLPDGNFSGWLVPPPNPLKVMLGNVASLPTTSYAKVRVQIGGMLALNNCALTKVTVKYDNTRSLVKQRDALGNIYLSPLFATISLSFKTVLGMTRLEYGDMLYLSTPQDNLWDLYEAEKYTINATEKEGWKGFKGAVKKGLGAVYDKFLG